MYYLNNKTEYYLLFHAYHLSDNNKTIRDTDSKIKSNLDYYLSKKSSIIGFLNGLYYTNTNIIPNQSISNFILVYYKKNQINILNIYSNEFDSNKTNLEIQEFIYDYFKINLKIEIKKENIKCINIDATTKLLFDKFNLNNNLINISFFKDSAYNPYTRLKLKLSTKIDNTSFFINISNNKFENEIEYIKRYSDNMQTILTFLINLNTLNEKFNIKFDICNNTHFTISQIKNFNVFNQYYEKFNNYYQNFNFNTSKFYEYKDKIKRRLEINNLNQPLLSLKGVSFKSLNSNIIITNPILINNIIKNYQRDEFTFAWLNFHNKLDDLYSNIQQALLKNL